MTQMMNNFSRKQAGVIYRAMKEGNLSIDSETVSYMYDLTDGGIDFNGSCNSDIQQFRLAVDSIFDGDYDKAQEHVNRIMGISQETDDEDEIGEDEESYTTSTGVTFIYSESFDGYVFREQGDPASEDSIDFIDSVSELHDHFEKMTAWMAA